MLGSTMLWSTKFWSTKFWSTYGKLRGLLTPSMKYETVAMNFKEFHASLNEPQPPAGLSDALTALWLQANDEWEAAHDQIRDNSDQASAWVHAHLHHVEGVLWNADYWYGRARKKRPSCSTQEEWQQIAQALLD